MPDTLAVTGPRGAAIKSVDDWRRHAPPAKGADHWKAGRSAMELAHAWFRTSTPALPHEVAAALECSPLTQRFRVETAWPEHEMKLDHRGKGRQHDLLARGSAGGRPAVMSVEAKADESFGPTISGYLAECVRKGVSRKDEGLAPSGVPDRIRDLCMLLFGSDVSDAIQALRYQLLHSVAGTVLEAAKSDADTCVFMVHEFPQAASPRKRRANANDLDRFASVLAGKSIEVAPGTLIGPFFIQPSGHGRRISLLIGKAAGPLDEAEGAGQFGPFIRSDKLEIGQVPRAGADLGQIWRFALTFDGYTVWGDQCGGIANLLLDEFQRTGILPVNIRLLRTALFFEQRRYRHFGREPVDKERSYIQALLEAMRSAVR